MTVAPWRSSLSGALHRNRSLIYSRYVQLATVREDGRPANRTIVFRGFWQDSNQLKFVTDDRSEKASQIVGQDWGEVCWYFPKTREQFRLLGQLTLIGADYPDATLANARQIQWQELSDAARSQFAWPHPGQPRFDEAGFNPAAPDAAEPLANFCLLLLNPIQVDHLELKGNPQNRCLYIKKQALETEQEQWQVQAINP